jgi:hypothetical protein
MGWLVHGTRLLVDQLRWVVPATDANFANASAMLHLSVPGVPADPVLLAQSD